MSGDSSPDRERRFERRVRDRERRKVRGRGQGEGFLSWLGAFGIVGWSIALPTVVGIAIGIWLDRRLASSFSWTITLLFVGVLVGCAIAWYWVRKESARS